jgi:O-antigen/teichoic acid export membrane protein
LGIIAACADQVAIGVLKGRFMFKAVAILEVVNRTCQVAATAVVAWLLLETKWLVVALAAAMLLGSALRLALAVNAVRPLRTEHLYETTISIVRSGRWIVVQSIGGYPYMGLDRLIVGYLLGPASVGLYGICVQFAQFAHMLPAAFFQPLMPAVSRMRSEGNVDEERVTVRRAGALCISASALIGITLVLATPWALRYWLGRDPVAEEIQSMQVASLAAALMGSLSAAHYAFMGRGQFFSVSVLNLLAGILFSLALFIFGETYGVAGAAWSRVIFPIIIGVGFLVLILMTRSRSSFMS